MNRATRLCRYWLHAIRRDGECIHRHDEYLLNYNLFLWSIVLLQ